MLLNAGQKRYQQFGYGQTEEDEESFSDDDDEEENEEEEDSDYDEDGLNSPQKKKLKRDLIMMGYQANEEFGGDEDYMEAENLLREAVASHQFTAGSATDAAQLQLLQQMQFEEAMRI